jgi:hypothetical protein
VGRAPGSAGWLGLLNAPAPLSCAGPACSSSLGRPRAGSAGCGGPDALRLRPARARRPLEPEVGERASDMRTRPGPRSGTGAKFTTGAVTLSAPGDLAQGLEGHYFTDRKTVGTMRFDQRYAKLVETHPAGARWLMQKAAEKLARHRPASARCSSADRLTWPRILVSCSVLSDRPWSAMRTFSTTPPSLNAWRSLGLLNPPSVVRTGTRVPPGLACLPALGAGLSRGLAARGCGRQGEG